MLKVGNFKFMKKANMLSLSEGRREERHIFTTVDSEENFSLLSVSSKPLPTRPFYNCRHLSYDSLALFSNLLGQMFCRCFGLVSNRQTGLWAIFCFKKFSCVFRSFLRMNTPDPPNQIPYSSTVKAAFTLLPDGNVTMTATDVSLSSSSTHFHF